MVLGLLMIVALAGVIVFGAASVRWNRRRGFGPSREGAPAYGFGDGLYLQEGNRLDVAERHQRAARIIRRGERAESPELALLVCQWAARSYHNWENPWMAWSLVFMAPLFTGSYALTGLATPEGALLTAVVFLVLTLALPVYRAHVLRRSAWAIETNRDLTEEFPCPGTSSR
ncbi:ABC transporter permease [Nocardiopsis exhalans]|uniref:ABC transporter permease n=1 Tax=Nocardiopsis exhalans TaxID=163604 RepID=A0ABY5D950_9ACTN|nr:ABC transporter permease [Nocardiopsis exhalans]USY19763.1 ABC transporter permease [Nocardiopsis exhalans]